HSLALASDGTVIGWWRNDFRQLLDGTTESPRSTPVVSTGLSGINIASIAVSTLHNLVLSNTNDVYGWGYNNYGNVGNGVNATPISLQTITENF
ncbi:MAG: hypothetical protein ACO27L_03575, partial [Schleiferiaceae bacterium]